MLEALSTYIQKDKKFELIQQGEDGSPKRFISHFTDKNSRFYTISTPKYGDNVCNLTVGESVKLYIYAPDGVFSLSVKVLKKDGENWQISLPSDIKHSQRREFLRVDMNSRVYLNIYRPDGSVVPVTALTTNLCGRGMCLALGAPIGDYLKIEVELLLEERTVETLAELVYSKPINVAGEVKFLCAFMFISVTDKDVDAIVKECLLFQLSSNKKKYV